MKNSLAHLHRSLNIDKNTQPLTKRELGGHCEGGEGMMRDSGQARQAWYVYHPVNV